MSVKRSKLCCACLANDRRLFDMKKHKLADAFFCFSGTPVNDPLLLDKLPQYLCSYCCTLLRKCASFKDMCNQTQQQLMADLLKRQLNTYACRINNPSHQFLNLTVTEVTVIDFTPLTEDINVLHTTTHIKDEPNIDIVDINSILKKTDKEIEIMDKIDEVNDDQPVVKVYKSTSLNTESNIENTFDDSSIDFSTETDLNMAIDVIDDKESTVKSVKAEFNTERTKTKMGDMSSIVKAKQSLKQKRRKIDVVKKKTQRELESVRKGTEETIKNEKFESTHAVKIVILSKEEQLSEVAARKETRNYLESHYKCEECWKGFDAKAAYENHILRHNPNTGAYMCEVCRVRFRVKVRLNNHMESHRLKIHCNECGFVSRTKSQAKDHHGLHAGRTFDCPHCGNSFQKRSSYLSHVRIAHPSLNVSCDVCGEMFVGDQGLKQHKSKTHAQNIKCGICLAAFVSVSALDRHTDTAGEHRDLRPCEQCGENCASEQALHEHLEKQHPKETHRCEECNTEFPSAAAYNIHHQRKHLNQKFKYNEAGRVAKRRAPASRGPRAQFVCEQCGHILPSDILLRYHQRKHLAVKPYACNHCPKTFDFKQVRDIHERSHTGEKPFKCDKCPRAFNVKTNLYRHNKTAHLNIHERVPCPICAREFAAKSYLRLHISTVHNGQPWPKRDRKRAKKP